MDSRPRRGGDVGAPHSAAAGRIAAGDHGYVARIITDSYHTVWFELHEDLMSLAGLTREYEALAGVPGEGNSSRPRP